MVVVDPLKNWCEGTLVTMVGIFYISVQFENIFILTINRIISQMHVQIINILLIRHLIFFCSKPCHSFAKEVDAQRIYTLDEDV